MLQKQLLEDTDRLRKEMLKPYVIIENAFDPEFAETLLADLSSNNTWVSQDQHTNAGSVAKQSSEFTYSRKQIHSDSENIPSTLLQYFEYLKSQEFISWINEISGKDCDSFWGGAAAFDEGDHISEHDDQYIYKDKNNNLITRSVTLTYYLNKFWAPEWGGALGWRKPEGSIIPDFNKLVLFNVGSGSHHWVTPVTSLAEERRFSITGWFLTTRKQEEIKKKRPNFKII